MTLVENQDKQDSLLVDVLTGIVFFVLLPFILIVFSWKWIDANFHGMNGMFQPSFETAYKQGDFKLEKIES